jgi:hypothetical protein
MLGRLYVGFPLGLVSTIHAQAMPEICAYDESTGSKRITGTDASEEVTGRTRSSFMRGDCNGGFLSSIEGVARHQFRVHVDSAFQSHRGQ